MQRDLPYWGVRRHLRHHGECSGLHYGASIRSGAGEQSHMWLSDNGNPTRHDRAQPITAFRAGTNRGPAI